MEKIGLFPLNTVLFPGSILPLRIFETRYIDLISECLRTNKGFGISLIRAGAEVGQAASCFDIGTYADIIDWNRQADGLLGIVVQGKQRFTIHSYSVRPNQLLEGDVQWLDTDDALSCPQDYLPLQELLRQVIEHYELPYQEQLQMINDSAWLGNRLAELLPLEPSLKQQLLEIEDPLERLAQIKDLVDNSVQFSQ